MARTIVIAASFLALAAPARAQDPDEPVSCWFHQGVFGEQSAVLDGNALLDSYSGSCCNPTFGQFGDVRSNTVVRLTGNAAVRGDARSSGKVVREGKNTTITGVVQENVATLTYPDLADVVAAMASSNDNANIPAGLGGTSFKLQGKDFVEIPPGHYYFSEFTMAGESTVKLTGPTVFYVSGPMKVLGKSWLNVCGDPKNLLVISSADGAQDVQVSGLAAKACGLFYAMKTRIHIGVNGEVFGAVIAREAMLNGNAKLHVPENLACIEAVADPTDPNGVGGGGASPP